MSFDVFLVGSSLTPEAAEVRSITELVLRREGVTVGADGVSANTSDGSEFDLYGRGDGAMFSFYGSVSPSACRVIYQVAETTKAFIVASGDAPDAFQTANNGGKPPADFLPVERVADVDALCAELIKAAGS